jgi:hypothetical protein
MSRVVVGLVGHPGSRIVPGGPSGGRFGMTYEVIAPDGRGIVYDLTGKFLYFSENAP